MGFWVLTNVSNDTCLAVRVSRAGRQAPDAQREIERVKRGDGCITTQTAVSFAPNRLRA